MSKRWFGRAFHLIGAFGFAAQMFATDVHAATRLFTFADDMICEINPTTGVEVFSWAVPKAGDYTITAPGLAFNGKEVFYTDERLYDVWVFDTSGRILRALPKTGFGVGLGVSDASLYSVGFGDDGVIAAVNPIDGALQGSFSVPGAGNALTYAGSRGTLFTAIGTHGQVAEVTPAGAVVNTFNTGVGSKGLCFSSTSQILYGVLSGQLYAFSPNNGALLGGYPKPITGLDGHFANKTGACGADEPACGDGRIENGEQCDDGNRVDGDGCDSNCRVSGQCGNNRIDSGETCDPPGSTLPNGSICRLGCTYCGDGRTNGGEQCDDGNSVNGDGCDTDCRPSLGCGNGQLDSGETCDPPGSVLPNGNVCRDDCAYCGDGRTNGGELCDDGNNVDGDGCDTNCRPSLGCGNGQLDSGETCDPPGSVLPNGNVCRDNCSYCGDGRTNPGEQCDDGNTNDNDGCTNSCSPGAGCSLDVSKTCCLPPPVQSNFVCSDAKPLDSLSMIWNGAEPIRIKAYKGSVGSTLLADIDGIQVGQKVTVTGFAGSPNDVQYEIFRAGSAIELGVSVFHLSCSDTDMNGPEDCGKAEGDSKGQSGFINQWIFEGFGGNGNSLECTPNPSQSACTTTSTPGPFTCSDAKPIDGLTMIWNGTEAVRIRAYKGAVGSTLLADIDNIQIGQEVTVRGFAGSPNDVFYEVFRAGGSTKLGNSVFHLSCSDADMNGREDCGKAEGDSKGQSGLINQWIFEGMSGSGEVLDCTQGPPPPPTDTCQVQTAPPPHCLTRVLALGLRYVGGGCSNSSNLQGKDAKCTGTDPGAGPVSLVFTKDADKLIATPSTGIGVGSVVVIRKKDSKELPADIEFTVTSATGGESLKLKADCGKPLNLGDRFGAVQVVSIDRKSLGLVTIGGQVEYSYTITNSGASPVSNISVQDDKLGTIQGSPLQTLQSGETVVLRQTAFVGQDTINTVAVSSNGQLCATDTASVTVAQTSLQAAGDYKRMRRAARKQALRALRRARQKR
jgi:cysteine-rich repeat protein